MTSELRGVDSEGFRMNAWLAAIVAATCQPRVKSGVFQRVICKIVP